ncbi:ATP-dependent Clp protease proteolytic subunit [Theileria orientalis strain Shintoku]|uniref:ATP-dependent Clp protease proteolytic subunit n=1 Tax=Theileria orientalis strain Shintoku TaxID=869250 RepID=J4DPP5_THEOR|nr:ATP-dependent Clp protease proteolytic subunit [Theileria orientalis strain Shintoku]PVC50616.1 ATP-dependent Clp protease proteolytic subunit [Theileria orientalis]BAM41064.1 ATP-dependent Clp protease proteolytic subunit [Theileria orientalis strain Shintoku]|eukprot:XP_009691365.1 ATP-dependent Clp protease proteolytic subunit [Theileria orientalis strain Shintoku]
MNNDIAYKSRPPDLPSLLLSERIVYIGYPIQQTVAHLVISQLLYLDYDSQEKPIKIYINSDNEHTKEEGLSTSEIDALNIVDVINYLKNDVITINLGKAYGPAAIILASGTPGKRYVLPRSYTLLRQSPATISFRQAEDIAIYSDEILKARKAIVNVLSKACNKETSEILERINRGDYMDSQIGAEMNRLFMIPRLVSRSDLSNWVARRSYAKNHRSGEFDRLLSRLERSIDHSRTDESVHKNVASIANEFLNNKHTFVEQSAFLSKIHKYEKLEEKFWNKYLGKLNERLAREEECEVVCEESVDELVAFSEIARVLISAGKSSVPLSRYFVKSVTSNIYNIIPREIRVFTRMLEYLVHAGSKNKLDPVVFELLEDNAWKIKPTNLISILYNLGKLGDRDEEVIRAFSRVLTNCLAKGILRPYDKTKLAKAYSLLNYEHITFFNQISKELTLIFKAMDYGNYFKKEEKGINYVQGVGLRGGKASGVMVEGLKYIQYYSNESDEVIEEPKRVEFEGTDEQLYSCGQMVFILDAMIYLRIHHLEPEFKNLISYALKHLYKSEVMEHFDVEQLRSAVSFLATCRKSIDDHLLENVTKRFVREYMDGNVTNAQLALFLKDLVKLTKIVVKRRNVRNRLLHTSTFVPPKWIHNQMYENADPMDPNSTRSTLEHLCYKICDNFKRFTIEDLTSCLRSVAYLGFKNEKFYSLFIPFLRQNLKSLSNVAVSNITQSFNRAGVKDKYFFYLLGKQHQDYLHSVEEKVYIKRIG